MTHALSTKAHENPLRSPLVATLRYQCTCAANEVLQIAVVLDMNVSEEQFTWTMHQLWRDVKMEVKQHLGEKA